MRLPLSSPSELSPEQRPLYDDMRKGIEASFKGFIAIDGSGSVDRSLESVDPVSEIR